jgi:hypothetical protein
MITGTVSGYHVGDVIEGLIRGGGQCIAKCMFFFEVLASY